MKGYRAKGCMTCGGDSWLWDASALLGLVLIVALSLARVLQPSWRSLYFYNGDSLTLALLWKSLRAGEPFHWVLSSQLFLFPEGGLYAASALVAPTTRVSFLINSAIAMVLLYVCYWVIGRLFFETRRAAHAFSLLAVGIILLYMWCETAPNINGKTFVTLYLFNTYYYGVILCGLLVLYWATRIVLHANDPKHMEKSVVAPFAGIVTVTALTYFSDPLFFLQCSIPLIVSVCLLGCARFLHGRFAILLIASQLVGIALGSVGRYWCKDYVGNPVMQYLDFQNIVKATEFVGKTVSAVAHTPTAVFEFGLMVLGVIAALFAVGCVWSHRPRDRSSSTTGLWAAAALIALFAVGAPISSIFGALATGNAWTRYWLPLAFFPVLSLIPLLYLAAGANCNRILMSTWVCVSLALILCCLWLYTSTAHRPHMGNMSSDVECYNRVMHERPFNTVGGFWSTRPLDLYSNTSSRSLQVIYDLSHQAWMNNLEPYSRLKFNGVVVAKLTSAGKLDARIYADEVGNLGPYSRKFNCPTFEIYYYETGSEGYMRLNELVAK